MKLLLQLRLQRAGAEKISNSIAQALSNNDEESRLVIHVCGQVWKKRIDNNNNASRRRANSRSADQNKVTSSMKLDVFCYLLRISTALNFTLTLSFLIAIFISHIFSSIVLTA